MMGPFSKFIASLRYLFVLAVLALAVLAFMSLARGIIELVRFAGSAGLEMKPGSGAAVVPYFIRAAFMYFLSVALCSLFVADVPVPQWMAVKNLFQFRTKILTFVSIILPLAFMGRLMAIDQSAPAVLYTGAGVFLVLAGIFLLIRFGSPSGDEGMARESNNIPENRPSHDRNRDRQSDRRENRAQGASSSAKASTSAKAAADRGRRSQQGNRPGSRTDQDEWLKKQKEDLKFQKETLDKAVDKEISGDTDSSHVTVKPGPRRPRGRR